MALYHYLGMRTEAREKGTVKRGIPFELQLPAEKPLELGKMTREELDSELTKGINSLNNGQGYSADEVDKILAEEFNI